MVKQFIRTNEIKEEKKMFIHTNELAVRQRWSAILCSTGVWGGKPIRRVSFKYTDD